MSLPISRNQTVRHVPLAYGHEFRALAEAAGEDTSRFDAPPTYILTVPTLAQRSEWRRSVNSTGARFHSPADLLKALRKQVAGALDEGDPERDQLLGQIDAYMAYPTGEAPDGLTEEVSRVEEIIRSSSTEYASMCAASQYWMEMAPLLACQHFLRAQENPDRVFRRKNGLVIDEELATIPNGERAEVGWRIINLMSPTPAQEKNSASPSSSPAGPTTSTAENAPQTAADGTSSANTTSEIPASC